jgi:zinc protease
MIRKPAAWLSLVVSAVLFLAASPSRAQERVFPYEVHKRTLDNGLDVIVIPTPEFKDVLSYNTMVLAGARNEVERGKSGLAHLFEHILFRHRWEGKEGGYDEAIGELGAFNNAFTNFDITFYHPLTFTSNLERLAALEADRFVNLDYTKKIFQTEAGSVLGEYRNSAANPGLRMSEVRSKLMYGDYGYGHTTIGYLEDVEDMPNEYEAAVKFYDEYYRPNNVVLIVTGDVDPDSIFRLAENLYGAWQPANPPDLPDPSPVGGPKREHVSWGVDVPPRVQVAYRMPPHRTGSVETAVGQLLPELLTSETAPLYRKLRFEKKLAAALFSGSGSYESFGPGSLTITAILFKEKFTEKGTALLDEVTTDVEQALKDLKSFASQPDAEETLEELKSKYAYDTLAGLDSPGDLATSFAWYYRFERDPNVFDRLVESVRKLTPQDIEWFAREYFVPSNQVIVTLAYEGTGAE